MTLYTFAKNFVNAIFKPLYRIQIIGLETFPKEGGVLLCTNHIHNFDPPVVGITCPRDVVFMAKEELFKTPIIGPVVANLNAFPVKRGMSDREALRKGLAALKENKVLGLFPEGHRSKTGELGKGLSGAGFFALRSDAHVVPCAIIGPYRPFKKLKVIYGEPIEMGSFREKKVSADEVTDTIMNNIRTLIEKHR